MGSPGRFSLGYNKDNTAGAAYRKRHAWKGTRWRERLLSTTTRAMPLVILLSAADEHPTDQRRRLPQYLLQA